MIPIICIEGPTASGKSALALQLAKKLNTEIISADSRQVYKYLNIGTAKPDTNTLQEIKHHLIDIINPNQRYSAGSFMKDAEIIINEIHRQNKTPIICGGSMLYIQSLLNGLSEIPDISQDIFQKTDDFIRENSLTNCYEFLEKIDPKFARSITLTDKQRIHRGLSVWFAFQKPITYFWENQKNISKYKPYKILINKDRNTLYKQINDRTKSMINQGLIDEIENVLKMGYKKIDYGLTSVGYAEFIDIILNKDTKNIPKMNECIELAAQHTRNYAKRQITWYKKNKYDYMITDDIDVLDEISHIIIHDILHH